MNARRFLVPAAALAITILQTTGARAEDTIDEAAERFERGLTLFDEHDYAASLAEFRRAYVLKPTYKLRYNVGRVCLELRDYVCALEQFEAYLSEGGDQV